MKSVESGIVRGEVVRVGAVEQRTEKFRAARLVVKTDEKYSPYHELEAVLDLADDIQNVRPGDCLECEVVSSGCRGADKDGAERYWPARVRLVGWRRVGEYAARREPEPGGVSRAEPVPVGSDGKEGLPF